MDIAGRPIKHLQQAVGVVHFPSYHRGEGAVNTEEDAAAIRRVVEWYAQKRYDGTTAHLDAIAARSLVELEKRSIAAAKICGTCTMNSEGDAGAPGIHTMMIADEAPFGLIYMTGSAHKGTETARFDHRTLTSIAF